MSSPRRVLDAVEKNVAAGAALGMLLLQAEDERLDGRHLQIRGRRLLAFTSCSYLGLELDARLIEGSVDAVRRYGTQFSASRTYVSAPPYHCVDEKAQIQAGAVQLVPGPAVSSQGETTPHGASAMCSRNESPQRDLVPGATF